MLLVLKNRINYIFMNNIGGVQNLCILKQLYFLSIVHTSYLFWVLFILFVRTIKMQIILATD